MQPHIHTLPNGLKTILVDTKAFPSITTILLVNAGSRFETPTNNGIAHFFEHMAFKGSKKYPTAHVLASIVDGFGGEFNAFTSKDYTGYYIKAPTQFGDTMIDVLADMIKNPLLQEEELQKEKGVICQEIGMYEDTPQRNIYNVFDNLLYHDSPLGMDILGTTDTVNSFTQNTFHDYMGSLYFPNNAVFVVAGGLGGTSGMDDFTKRLDSHFGDWKKGTPIHFEEAVDAQVKPGLRVKFKKATEQAHLCFGYRTFKEQDDRKHALSVFSAILGAGMSSRLFTEVREKRGLCYAIRTMTDHYADVGNMLTYAGVSTDLEKVREAVKVIRDQHELIATAGVTEEELRKGKEILKGHMLLALEDTLNVALMYGKDLLHEGTIHQVEDVMAKIDAVTSQEVTNIAKTVVQQNLSNLAVIGPFKDPTVFEDLLF